MALTQEDIDLAVARALSQQELQKSKGYGTNILFIDWAKVSSAFSVSPGPFDLSKGPWHVWYEALLNQALLHGDLARYFTGVPPPPSIDNALLVDELTFYRDKSRKAYALLFSLLLPGSSRDVIREFGLEKSPELVDPSVRALAALKKEYLKTDVAALLLLFREFVSLSQRTFATDSTMETHVQRYQDLFDRASRVNAGIPRSLCAPLLFSSASHTRHTAPPFNPSGLIRRN